MASTYQEMLDRLQSLTDRDDATEQIAFTSGNTLNLLNDAYGRAERRAYREGYLKLPPFESEITYTVEPGQTELPIPRGYFAMRFAIVSSGQVDLPMERVAPEQILGRVNGRQVGYPTRIAYGTNRWIIEPSSERVTIRLVYYSELAPVSTITDPNEDHWLVNYADDYLLYLAAVECGLHFRHLDQNELAAFEGKAQNIAESIMRQYTEQLESGSNLKWGRAYARPGFYSAGRGNYFGY